MAGERRPTVHVGAAWRLLFRDLDIDHHTVLRRAGQPPTLFDGDGTHIPIDDFYALFAALEAEAEDATIALRAGQLVSVELFDPALFAALCSPDFNTAAKRLGDFKRLVGQFVLDVTMDDQQTFVGYRCKLRPDLPMLHGLAEAVLLVAFARRATRHHIVPARVVVQRMPADPSAFVDYFGCSLERGQTYGVGFCAEDARRPFLTHNAGMWEAFEPALRRRIAEADERRSTADLVQTALFELLPSGRTQMRDVAKELGVGPRTLQRRLSAEGTTWLNVLNETRERLARHYLQSTTMAPAEIGFLLGFDDPNSLFRAFHRWTGTTPESWRAASEPIGSADPT